MLELCAGWFVLEPYGDANNAEQKGQMHVYVLLKLRSTWTSNVPKIMAFIPKVEGKGAMIVVLWRSRIAYTWTPKACKHWPLGLLLQVSAFFCTFGSGRL